MQLTCTTELQLPFMLGESAIVLHLQMGSHVFVFSAGVAIAVGLGWLDIHQGGGHTYPVLPQSH